MTNELEELKDWIEKLKNSSKLIIVEGKKDKRALEKLGITNIKILKKPLFEVVEEVAKHHKKVIILTDLDKEGKKLYGVLKKDLARNGVFVDDEFRDFLFKNTKLTQVEGIDSYIYKITKNI